MSAQPNQPSQPSNKPGGNAPNKPSASGSTFNVAPSSTSSSSTQGKPNAPATKPTTPPAKPKTEDDPRVALRRSLYAVLIVVGVGGMSGRILAVNSVDKIGQEAVLRKTQPERIIQRPFLSGNDRSRWCTVRSLVELGTYQIDNIVNQENWDTIDMVKHDGHGKLPTPPARLAADEGHLYSSKPPFLSSLIAGPYWVIVRASGWTLGTHPYFVGRTLLILVNVLPAIFYFIAVAQMVERYGRSDWGRLFAMACAVFATFLSTFAVVLTNHLPAAYAAAIGLNAALKVYIDRNTSWFQFLLAGFFSAFAAACELPALALCAALFVALLLTSWRKTLFAALPGALIVVGAFFGTNYAAHETLLPAYAMRHGDEAPAVGATTPAAAPAAAPADPFAAAPGAPAPNAPAATPAAAKAAPQQRYGWYFFDYKRGERVIPSYWSDPTKQSAIDRGEPDQAIYAFHALVGHHGIFSLTPVWLLALVGGLAWLFRAGRMRWAALALLAVSSVCIVFYIMRPMADRNYGGMTSGFRWAFWMAPLWLVMMLPAADGAGKNRILRGACLILLVMSVLSVTYPTWNPWTQPWLTDFLLERGLIGLGPR
ncbi:MAG: hypothetical protein JSS27_12340 [Planctomycetes bacterium]|nr:hypothetical protein [Planctomycetota bacterium]